MKRLRFAGLVAMCATLTAAVFAGTATPAASAPATVRAGNTVAVHFAVSKFVVRNHQLVALGRTVATVQTTSGVYTTTKPFAVRAVRHAGALRSTQAATRICNVLSLTLGPLHLELLGLIVDLNKVNLTIQADSNGGLLGSLLCGLAGGSSSTSALTSLASQLTSAAQKSGLSVGPGFTVPLATATPGTQQAAQTCTVLDLTLGPIDLNLLGLLVHLDQVHLTITADPNGGLLGSLLCSLAGGVPTGG
jgi:hypothetical protein